MWKTCTLKTLRRWWRNWRRHKLMERYPWSWNARITVVKMSILPKAMYTVNASPPEIPMVFSTEIEQILLIFVWNHKGPRIAKATLRKENRLEAISLPNFTVYWEATVTKTVQNWHKNRHRDQRNRTESTELNPHGWGPLIYDKGAKDTPRGRTAPTINSAGKTGHSITHTGYTAHQTD